MAVARRIYIIGFMGSGKSTAGKNLSAELGWKFVDLDNEIEQIEGRSIAEIFNSSGEEYFRKIESETLHKLNTGENTVISTGGGTPCFGSNMDYMTSTGIVIYLRMTPLQLMSRLDRSGRARPLIKNMEDNELLKYISGKLAEREKYYLRSSVIVDGIDPDIKDMSKNIRRIFKE